jgi:hypothetical protein
MVLVFSLLQPFSGCRKTRVAKVQVWREAGGAVTALGLNQTGGRKREWVFEPGRLLW